MYRCTQAVGLAHAIGRQASPSGTLSHSRPFRREKEMRGRLACYTHTLALSTKSKNAACCVQSRAQALRSSDYKPCTLCFACCGHVTLRETPSNCSQLQPLHCRRGDERLQAHPVDAGPALDDATTSRSERSAILEQSQGGLLRRLCKPSSSVRLRPRPRQRRRRRPDTSTRRVCWFRCESPIDTSGPRRGVGEEPQLWAN